MHSEVRKHFKEMQDQWSEEPDPATSCTERMARLMLTAEVIPGQRSKRLLATRDVVSSGFGAYAGTRIGETADSEKGHGVTCPHVCVPIP